MSPLLPISSLKDSVSSSMNKGGQGQRQRMRVLALALIACPLYLLLSSHGGQLPFTSGVNERKLVASLCPSASVSNYVPTIILRASGDVDRNSNRTYWVDPEGNSTMLPGAHPRQELRFSRKRPQALDDSTAATSSFYSSTPPPPADCSFQVVPSSPSTLSPAGWKDNSIMFGMSTKAERILYNIPVWDHWLPTHRREFNAAPMPTTDLPLVFALIPPPTAKDATRLSEGLDDLQEMGLNVKVTATVAPRFERRYLQLVQEMWAEAQRREELEGVVTEWFVFADDDTFFLEWNGLTRMLAGYNSSDEILIGGLSEVALQVEIFGRMAFGGAGIFVSRALMQRMNAPGVYDSCVERFGSTFGGDAMASYCAAASTISLNATDAEVLKRLDTLLVIDDTLHQVDIRGDGTGFLQAGFLFTSFHHWASWVDVWPTWHSNAAGDIRSTIMLMGEAAMRVGGDNFGRRYVFEQGEIVVTLGYSVSVYRESLNATQLAQVEHTWERLETFLPMRRPLVESIEKRNYYLTGTRKLSAGVFRLEHTDQTGDRVDIIWDARAATPKASTWPQWRKERPAPKAWTFAEG